MLVVLSEDVSSTGDIQAKKHNYTTSSANVSWGTAIYKHGSGSSRTCTFRCTDCSNTASGSVSSSMTVTQNQACEKDELGTFTFKATVYNPRGGSSITASTTDSGKVCSDHKKQGHQKSASAYSTTAATCTTQSTEIYRCVRYGNGGCTKTYEEHATAALQHVKTPAAHTHSAYGGSCYTANYHSHSNSCYTSGTAKWTSCTWDGPAKNGSDVLEGRYKLYCSRCKKSGYAYRTSTTYSADTQKSILNNETHTCSKKTLSCGKTTSTVESYTLNCSKTVDYYYCGRNCGYIYP